MAALVEPAVAPLVIVTYSINTLLLWDYGSRRSFSTLARLLIVCLALFAPVGPGHVAVADEAAGPGLVKHQVVEHQPAAIAQQERLAEHGFAGGVQRPGAGQKGIRVGKPNKRQKCGLTY